jgi:molecular chaperone GrpE
MMANNREDILEIDPARERPPGAESNEYARLKAELRSERELCLRTLADFDNYRRRTEKERASFGRAGKRELMLPLLEVLDDFNRAREHLGNAPEWACSGFDAIYRRLDNILRAQGVAPYESVGGSFDPVRHEAVGLAENQDVEPGTVVAEISRGYCWGDEVLRPARVRVAQ